PPEPSIIILPQHIALTAPATADDESGEERLIVERSAGGRWVGDVTSAATFRSSAPKVASVGRDGTLRPLAPGSAVVTARVGPVTALVSFQVRVAPARGAPGGVRSFRNQVEPVLTKMGCNSGRCHGAADGQ